MPPETLTDDEHKRILAHLDILLKTLPTQLPFKSLSDSAFVWLYRNAREDWLWSCSVRLKRIFGWKAHTSNGGILPITERGPGVNSLHHTFSKLYAEHRDNNVLKKWVIDVTNAAERVHADMPVSALSNECQKNLTSELKHPLLLGNPNLRWISITEPCEIRKRYDRSSMRSVWCDSVLFPVNRYWIEYLIRLYRLRPQYERHCQEVRQEIHWRQAKLVGMYFRLWNCMEWKRTDRPHFDKWGIEEGPTVTPGGLDPEIGWREARDDSVDSVDWAW